MYFKCFKYQETNRDYKIYNECNNRLHFLSLKEGLCKITGLERPKMLK